MNLAQKETMRENEPFFVVRAQKKMWNGTEA